MGYFMMLVILPMAVWALWRSEQRRVLLLRYLIAGAVCLICVAPAALAISGLASQGEVPGLVEVESIDLFAPPGSIATSATARAGRLRAERGRRRRRRKLRAVRPSYLAQRRELGQSDTGV